MTKQDLQSNVGKEKTKEGKQEVDRKRLTTLEEKYQVNPYDCLN